MPTIDFDHNPGFPGSNYDVLIVGAGAAGLYLASELARTKRVLVLESGHFQEDERKQALNTVVQTGKPLDAAVWGRRRAVGGSTIAWGGQSLPFGTVDFEERPGVAGSGWPVGLEDLRRHYDAANAAMGIDTLDYREEAFCHLGRWPPPVNPALVDIHVSKWAPEPNFRKIFARSISSSFDVLYNCQTTSVRVFNGAATAVEVGNFKGARTTFSASLVVLAGGALETVRLLLLAARDGAFTAEQQARLGVGFMDHPCIDMGEFIPSSPYTFQRAFGTQRKGGRKYSVRLSAATPFLRERELLGVSASFMAFPRGDAFDPYRDFGSTRRLFARPSHVSKTVGAFARTGWALVHDRFVYKHGSCIRLALMCEQEPDPLSRLSLHPTEVDDFGVSRLSVNWHVTPRTWRSVVAFTHALQSEMARLRLGDLNIDHDLDVDPQEGTALLTDVIHHMGGAAMGEDPSKYVVSPSLQVHGVDNLYVCSTAAFPTGSHSNPTLTLLALSHRLGERLA